MAKWDQGAYSITVCEGKQEDDTDTHSVNQRAAGLDTRGTAKTFIYAFLYGAGDTKIGSIVGKGRTAGKALRAKFLAGLPALGKLIDAVKRASSKGYLIGLDGRQVRVRSDHAALNTLLQSAGAIVMKKALCILDDSLQSLGLRLGVDYEFMGNIHDEFQLSVLERHAELVGKTAVESIMLAGEYFKMRCPLTGEYKIGKNWADTH
jgi:DNA polymerase I-like protein with 3'-5' exonuclease and polymerase domains